MDFDYKDFFKRLYAKIFDDDMLSRAATVAFYFSFALFPLLLFVLSLFGIVLNKSDDFRAELFLYLRQMMPGTAFALVESTLREVAGGTSGSKITFGLLITLYSASAGLDSLRSALDGVYNLKETRPYWKTKLTSILMTLCIGFLVFIAVGLVFYGSELLTFVLPVDTPQFLLKVLGFVIVFVALILAFGLIYTFLPNHDPFSWKWLSPGAFSAMLLWLVLSGGFRLYLHFFDSYSKTYGSLGAVIVLMLWLYLTALVVLIGGAVNAIFDDNSGINQENKDKKQQASEEKTANADLADAMQKQPDGDVENASDKSKNAVENKRKTVSDTKKNGDEAAKKTAEERTFGKMVIGGILGGIISYFSKRKK